jgi:hypothetical protein
MTPALFGSNWGRSFSSPACKHSLDLVKHSLDLVKYEKHSRSEVHSNRKVCLLVPHGLVFNMGPTLCVCGTARHPGHPGQNVRTTLFG